MASHEELIKAGTFDEKFKNALRDYYAYGFKSLTELQYENEKGKLAPSEQTIDADWKRLTSLLHDYFEWAENEDAVYFMSADSQSMNGNPFHRVYRFCRYNLRDPNSFFSTLFALSPNVLLRNGIESLEIDEMVDPASDPCYRLEKDIEAGMPLSSAELLCFFPDGAELFVGENNTINNKLKELDRLGLIQDVAGGKERGKKTTHRWALTEIFLNGVLAEGKKRFTSFESRFQHAIDFFSQFSLLGEVGSIILARCNHNGKSVFRFKHEYLMQCLNDYNILDLLYAIENNLWCEIDYRKGINRSRTVKVCYPLEIRTSSTSGRQYLACYDPFSRTFSNLRIEFIDSIAYVKDGEVIDSDGKRISLENENSKADIANALEALRFSWGASTSMKKRSSAKYRTPLSRVHLRIAFNPQTENYILERLLREQRIGKPEANIEEGYIDFYVQVTDPREMRPWIRSFYSRLISYDGIEHDGFTIKGDLASMKCVVDEDRIPVAGPTIPGIAPLTVHRNTPKGVEYKTVPSLAHQSLFNEFFSVYYFAIAETLMEISSSTNEQVFTQSQLNDIIIRSLEKYVGFFGLHTKELLVDELKNFLTSGVFLRKGFTQQHSLFTMGQGEKQEHYNLWVKKRPPQKRDCQIVNAYLPKYTSGPISFYLDIMPLTKIECRWLLTVMDDPKMHLFLSSDEIAFIKEYLYSKKGTICKFPNDKLIYTDRFMQRDGTYCKEQKFMNTILSAANSHKMVHIRYLSAKGVRQSGVFAPVVVEYSKRDDLFRGYFLSKKDGRFSVMNIARIQSLKILDEGFDYIAASKKLVRYREKSNRQITVEFYDVKNTADRILSEFSPWKKRCQYNRATGLYTLTIYYQKQDAVDLVVRLLGYGSTIRILDKDSLIYKLYTDRIDKQIEIEQQRGTAIRKAKVSNDEPARV